MSALHVLKDNARKFVTTEPLSEHDQSHEKRVWSAVKQAFADNECLGYSHYPLFSKQGEARSEPDIVIADRELGLVVIEVRPFAIDEIEEIDGDTWTLRGRKGRKSAPFDDARTKLKNLISFCEGGELFRVVGGRAFVALPNIRRVEWRERGLDQQMGEASLLFEDDLGKQTLLRRVEDTTPLVPTKALSDKEWMLLKGELGGTPIYRRVSENHSSDTSTRKGVVEDLRRRLYDLDVQQEHIGKEIPPGPQRIRGIAGSGKTVLLCQKAAHMHLKHPEWQIALVFHTRSLYDQIERLVNRWIKRFSDDKRERDPEKLQILHGWGAKDQPGLYGEVCRHHGVRKMVPPQFDKGSPAEKLAQACARLLEKKDIKPTYDAILIDEGQDMVVADEYMYEGKQPIYWLAYQALRPNEEGMRRLIWAYDEAQSLGSLKIPQAKELFGEKRSRIVSGTYPGGIRKSEIMKRCYRTPGPVLVAAHALGMGLKRNGGMIAGFTRQDEWEAIGYEVEGNFQASGNEVILNRPSKNSPNPVPEMWGDSVINFDTYDSREDEVDALARKIRRNIEVDGLSPSRDILVIVLGQGRGRTRRRQGYVAMKLQEHGIDTYTPTAGEVNAPVRKEDRRPNQFWHDGGVTVSRIHRAKGNEAEMVYIVAVDRVARNESDPYMRNQLFVALTRSKGWVELSGTEHYDLYDEIEEVIEAGEILEFEFSRPERDMGDKVEGELLESEQG